MVLLWEFSRGKRIVFMTKQKIRKKTNFRQKLFSRKPWQFSFWDFSREIHFSSKEQLFMCVKISLYKSMTTFHYDFMNIVTFLNISLQLLTNTNAGSES